MGKRLFLLSVVVGSAAIVLMLLTLRIDVGPALAYGTLTGQSVALVVAAGAHAVMANDRRYFRAYLRARPSIRLWAEDDDVLRDVTGLIEKLETDYVASAALESHVVDEDFDAHAYDLFGPSDRSVLFARGRHTGTILAASVLEDGRTLVTANHAIPPHSSLVIHGVPGGDEMAVADAHRAVARQLHERDIRHQPATVGVFERVMVAEWDAYRALGPGLASLVDPVQGWSPVRFTVPTVAAQRRAVEAQPESIARDEARLAAAVA